MTWMIFPKKHGNIYLRIKKGLFSMAEKLSNEEAYNLHIKSWKEAGIKITKDEIDDLQFLYKIGKYAGKKDKK